MDYSEKAHFTVFLIGIIIMFGGVLVAESSLSNSMAMMFIGAGMAIVACISAIIKYTRTGEL